MMKYIALTVGPMAVNCYVLWCEKTNKAVLIDPGEAKKPLEAIAERGLTVEKILLTHGHFDHIWGVGEVARQTGAQIAIHRLDAPMLTDADLNRSVLFGGQCVQPPADILLEDGDRIAFGECALTVVHTPGHTPGGVCFAHDDVIFTGDTLFYLSIGRTDLSGGSVGQIAQSISERLFVSEQDKLVLPGHGETTSLFFEMKHNPFVRGKAI